MNISLTNVSAGYGKDNLIIKNINHEFNEGGVWGILGPNGAGKTTLLRVLAGILPYSGNATLIHSNSVKENSESKDATESFEISKTSHKELAKYIAMMPQFSSIYFSYRSGRRSFVRSSDCSFLHRSTFAWSPDRRTAGTVLPRQVSGLEY